MTRLIDDCISRSALLEELRKHIREVIPVSAEWLITNAPTVQREGWVSVPFDLLNSFPEINLSNYGDEEVRNLNNWGIELVNSAAPKE